MTEESNPSRPNYSAERVLTWGDGSYPFKLPIKQIGELQKLCGAGFGTIISRVLGGAYYVEDVYETIRLGLIGGGMAPVEAKRKVDLYVDGCALARAGDPANNLATAQAILDAAIFGVDELKDAGDKKKDETPEETGSSILRSSTGKDSAQASAPEKSESSLSTSSTPESASGPESKPGKKKQRK